MRPHIKWGFLIYGNMEKDNLFDIVWLISLAIILALIIMNTSCSNSRDVIYQYQRGGVQPCGVCK